jgi:hypothetical protein
MAVKVPTIWNDMYIGNMSEPQAELIMQTRQSNVIPNLKKMLFNFPYELIQQSIEEQQSIRNIIKRDNIDYTQYISELRDYQTVGTAFMYLSPRSIIADGCGLGKTAEVSALINWLLYKGEMTRFLMAVENSAVGQTQAEIMRFTGLYVVALPSEAAKLKKVIEHTDWTKVDGIVIKHSTLRSDAFSKWLALNINSEGLCNLFDTFFLDESSVIKNDTTKMYQYTKNICQIVKRVHLMNATTFETSIVIYNQIDMMDQTLLPKKWRIEKEFCTFTRTQYWTKENGKAKLNWRHERSGYKNQAIFKESLKLVYFGRCKADIGMDLPHVYKVFEVEPTNAMSVGLSKGYRYSELLNCPSLIPEANIPMDRKNVPKLDRLCDLVENDFSDSSIMIYCFHIEAQRVIADELAKIGRKPVILNGSITDSNERYKIQQDFNNGIYDVIITNIKKSLNLYGGDVCIFYSMETNPSKSFQIASRIDRNVSDDIKTFVMLLYKGTDEYKFFTTTVKQRAKDARDLTIDAKTTVDFFFESMMAEETAELNGKA